MNEEKTAEMFLAAGVARDGAGDRDPLDAVKAVAEPRRLNDKTGEGDMREEGASAALAEDKNPAAKNEQDFYGEFSWPDGYAADPQAMSLFLPLARKLGLPKESAQELASLYAELDSRRHHSQAEFIARNNAEWLREIKNHPEFGGNNLEQTGESVARVMRRYGSPLLQSQIRQMNIQNWPEMFYFLARVSQAMSEDCSPSGVGQTSPTRSTAQLLFPGLT